MILYKIKFKFKFSYFIIKSYQRIRLVQQEKIIKTLKQDSLHNHNVNNNNSIQQFALFSQQKILYHRKYINIQIHQNQKINQNLFRQNKKHMQQSYHQPSINLNINLINFKNNPLDGQHLSSSNHSKNSKHLVQEAKIGKSNNNATVYSKQIKKSSSNQISPMQSISKSISGFNNIPKIISTNYFYNSSSSNFEYNDVNYSQLQQQLQFHPTISTESLKKTKKLYEKTIKSTRNDKNFDIFCMTSSITMQNNQSHANNSNKNIARDHPHNRSQRIHKNQLSQQINKKRSIDDDYITKLQKQSLVNDNQNKKQSYLQQKQLINNGFKKKQKKFEFIQQPSQPNSPNHIQRQNCDTFQQQQLFQQNDEVKFYNMLKGNNKKNSIATNSNNYYLKNNLPPQKSSQNIKSTGNFQNSESQNYNKSSKNQTVSINHNKSSSNHKKSSIQLNIKQSSSQYKQHPQKYMNIFSKNKRSINKATKQKQNQFVRSNYNDDLRHNRSKSKKQQIISKSKSKSKNKNKSNQILKQHKSKQKRSKSKSKKKIIHLINNKSKQKKSPSKSQKKEQQSKSRSKSKSERHKTPSSSNKKQIRSLILNKLEQQSKSKSKAKNQKNKRRKRKSKNKSKQKISNKQFIHSNNNRTFSPSPVRQKSKSKQKNAATISKKSTLSVKNLSSNLAADNKQKKSKTNQSNKSEYMLKVLGGFKKKKQKSKQSQELKSRINNQSLREGHIVLKNDRTTDDTLGLDKNILQNKGLKYGIKNDKKEIPKSRKNKQQQYGRIQLQVFSSQKRSFNAQKQLIQKVKTIQRWFRGYRIRKQLKEDLKQIHNKVQQVKQKISDKKSKYWVTDSDKKETSKQINNRNQNSNKIAPFEPEINQFSFKQIKGTQNPSDMNTKPKNKSSLKIQNDQFDNILSSSNSIQNIQQWNIPTISKNISDQTSFIQNQDALKHYQKLVHHEVQMNNKLLRQSQNLKQHIRSISSEHIRSISSSECYHQQGRNHQSNTSQSNNVNCQNQVIKIIKSQTQSKVSQPEQKDQQLLSKHSQESILQSYHSKSDYQSSSTSQRFFKQNHKIDLNPIKKIQFRQKSQVENDESQTSFKDLKNNTNNKAQSSKLSKFKQSKEQTILQQQKKKPNLKIQHFEPQPYVAVTKMNHSSTSNLQNTSSIKSISSPRFNNQNYIPLSLLSPKQIIDYENFIKPEHLDRRGKFFQANKPSQKLQQNKSQTALYHQIKQLRSPSSSQTMNKKIQLLKKLFYQDKLLSPKTFQTKLALLTSSHVDNSVNKVKSPSSNSIKKTQKASGQSISSSFIGHHSSGSHHPNSPTDKQFNIAINKTPSNNPLPKIQINTKQIQSKFYNLNRLNNQEQQSIQRLIHDGQNDFEFQNNLTNNKKLKLSELASLEKNSEEKQIIGKYKKQDKNLQLKGVQKGVHRKLFNNSSSESQLKSPKNYNYIQSNEILQNKQQVNLFINQNQRSLKDVNHPYHSKESRTNQPQPSTNMNFLSSCQNNFSIKQSSSNNCDFYIQSQTQNQLKHDQQLQNHINNIQPAIPIPQCSGFSTQLLYIKQYIFQFLQFIKNNAQYERQICTNMLSVPYDNQHLLTCYRTQLRDIDDYYSRNDRIQGYMLAYPYWKNLIDYEPVISVEVFQQFSMYLEQKVENQSNYNQEEGQNRNRFLISLKQDKIFQQVHPSSGSLIQLQRIFLMMLLDSFNQAFQQQRYISSGVNIINEQKAGINNHYILTKILKISRQIQVIEASAPAYYRFDQSQTNNIKEQNLGNSNSNLQSSNNHQFFSLFRLKKQKEDLIDIVFCSVLKRVLQNWARTLCGLIIQPEQQAQMGITQQQIQSKNAQRLCIALNKDIDKYQKQYHNLLRQHQICSKISVTDKILECILQQFEDQMGEVIQKKMYE